jgi:4-hydroxy-tetrahydrodipicolinate synthase
MDRKMARRPLKGLFPLMPFVLKKNREIDLAGLRANVRAYERAGFDGFVAFGCMGEFYSSNLEEFKAVVDAAVGASKRIACVIGTTFHNTRECIARTRYAQDAGADGVMIGLPYLIPCTAEAAFEHFRRVNEVADDVQIMVYNNPFSFRFNIGVELWDKLMQLDRIRAVKESNGEVVHRNRVISHISKRINVFSGGENWLLGDSLVGANSLVGVVAPGAPQASRQFFQACMEGDLSRALPFHVKFTEVYDEQTAQNEVAWEKACAELGGLRAGPPREPYAPLDEAVRARLASGLAALRKMAASGAPRQTKAREGLHAKIR